MIMSPSQLYNLHAKRVTLNDNGIVNNSSKDLCPPPLKINKDSHLIKKSLSSSSSSAGSSLVNGLAAMAARPPQRQPVIIYTQTPKIIHTHPRDFMALVQKLTGLTPSNKEAPPVKPEPGVSSSEDESNNTKIVGSEDTESSPAISEENCSSTVAEGQVNSCSVTPIFEPQPNPNNYLTNLQLFTPNTTDFLIANPNFSIYADSFFLNPSIGTSIPSSFCSGVLEEVNEFQEY